MNGNPSHDAIVDIVDRLKNLHILAREMFTDEELNAALAFFRPTSFRRANHDSIATYHLLQALRKFFNALPCESGASPFEYRK
jgi:hypothetical protein